MHLTLSDSPPTSQEMLPSFTCSIRLLAAQQARCAWSSPNVEQGHNLSVTAVVAGAKKKNNNTNPPTESAIALAPINTAEGFMNSSLAWNIRSPSFGFDFRAALRQGYKFLPTKFFSQVFQTFLCNMAPVVQLQCQILVSRAPAPSTAAARSTEAPEMPWQRWIGSIHRPKVTTSWRQELNIFYGQPVQPCDK